MHCFLMIQNSKVHYQKTVKRCNLELNPKEKKGLNYVQLITQKLYQWSS